MAQVASISLFDKRSITDVCQQELLRDNSETGHIAAVTMQLFKLMITHDQKHGQDPQTVVPHAESLAAVDLNAFVHALMLLTLYLALPG